MKDATEEQYEKFIEVLRREGAAKLFPDFKWIFDARIVNEGDVLQFFVTKRSASEQTPVYECGNCHIKFMAPWEHRDFDKIGCPGCGKEWTKEELAELKK